MRKLLASIALLIVVVSSCAAGPNDSELKSYRLLVPESSGGFSPAISFNGDNLAYYSSKDSFLNDSYISTGDVYITAACDLGPNSIPTSSKLEYSAPNGTNLRQISHNTTQTRDMDWSPDGWQLAFIGKGGHLYVANNINKYNQTTTVRAVVLSQPDDNNTMASIGAPRWSPDGKKIAYIKSSANNPTKVCIVDVESGQESVLATDAIDHYLAWEKPWSPDGKYIVYTGGKGQFSLGLSISGKLGYTLSRPITKGTKETEKTQGSYIAIVSVDGKTNRKLITGDKGLFPSWSPNGNQIMFASPSTYTIKLASGRKLEGITMGIWISDIQGKHKKAVTSPTPLSMNDALACEAAFVRELRKSFEDEFGKNLTTYQLKRLKAGTMTTDEMSDIAAASIYKETGVNIKSKEKKRNQKEPKALDSKYVEASGKAMQYIMKAMYESFLPMMQKFLVADMKASWSPDGRSIAYTHNVPIDEEYGQLFVKNLQTGKVSLLMDQAGINFFSWTRSGKSIVAQTRRATALRENSMDNPRSFGNPEIWILDIK